MSEVLTAQPPPVGPSGNTIADFEEGQWWMKELDAMVLNGTGDQKRAVAVVRNLLKTAKVTAAAPQAVPVPAGWSVTYDGKRASYIYADQETAEFEAQQVGGTARAVAVYLAAAPKEQPHE